MSHFFELIQVALGHRTKLSTTPSPKEWEEIYQSGVKHTLTGILYSGIERLPKEQQPDLSLLWLWNDDTKKIEEDNIQHRKRASQLLNKLLRDGYKAVIFKGPSLYPYYPDNLKERRTPGDIDVWIVSATKDGRTIPVSLRQIIEYAQKTLPDRFLCYVHYDFDVFSDVPVELHLRPSFLCIPLYNHRLQKWFRSVAHEVKYEDTQIRTEAYCILLLLHIYKHLFETGIGLRQLLDFYIVLEYYKTTNHKDLDEALLAYLGLSQFYQDLRYVMSVVFSGEEPTPTANERGQFLLDEIMNAGNFGHHDQRIKQTTDKTSFAIEKLKHNFRLLRQYPSEVLWEPFFRIYHWMWRSFRLWRFE